jgi:hypothetical protein
VRLDEKTRISHALGQVEDLFGKLTSFLVLGPDHVKRPYSEEHTEELGRFPDLSAEL